MLLMGRFRWLLGGFLGRCYAIARVFWMVARELQGGFLRHCCAIAGVFKWLLGGVAMPLLGCFKWLLGNC